MLKKIKIIFKGDNKTRKAELFSRIMSKKSDVKIKVIDDFSCVVILPHEVNISFIEYLMTDKEVEVKLSTTRDELNQLFYEYYSTGEIKNHDLIKKVTSYFKEKDIKKFKITSPSNLSGIWAISWLENDNIENYIYREENAIIKKSIDIKDRLKKIFSEYYPTNIITKEIRAEIVERIKQLLTSCNLLIVKIDQPIYDGDGWVILWDENGKTRNYCYLEQIEE